MDQVIPASISQADEKIYKRRIFAWTMYDWANSAFATTILAAVLPVYFSQVAGATLPSATVATSYWSLGLTISLVIVAIISPLLGTISDITRGKKRLLAVFAGIGIVSTALLVLVTTGDWVLAGILGIIGRIGFNGSITFYDALLPHIARDQDRDAVSARGYAMGYLGGGLLLAANIIMIQVLPGTWGARLSFLSVAIWWLVFSIPLFRHIPEPPAESKALSSTKAIVSESFSRLASTFRDVRRYRELFKYLISFIVYNDGIGTIIGVAAIYGAELGFGSVELILALLLVQFVGIPYSLIFGRLPNPNEKRRPFFLAFILLNMVCLPLTGILGARLLPANMSGARPDAYTSTAAAVGQGLYLPSSQDIKLQGAWIPSAPSEQPVAQPLITTTDPAASAILVFNGQRVELIYGQGPDHGIWAVHLDGQPIVSEETGQPVTIDGYNETPKFDASETFQALDPGEHTLELVNTGQRNPSSLGSQVSLVSFEVLQPSRQSNLAVIIGIIFCLELLLLVLALLLGPIFLSNAVKLFDTKRSIILSLVVYSVVAVWGYFLDSVIEFWFLAWMVAIVQGGSQALSRSLYSAMTPAYKSGEFFGLFGIMEKVSTFFGPLFFVAAGLLFGRSQPAILSLIIFFVVGGFLLSRVDTEEGKRVAKMEDAALLENKLAA